VNDETFMSALTSIEEIHRVPDGDVSSGPRRTLLVVDDEDGPRHSLNMVFKEDYQVLLAASGDEAIELASHHSIDAAILDIRMRGMSGIDLLQRLKVMDPSIEVVMLTGYESIETVRQALRLGAADYLNKPFELETMKAAVSNAMARRTFSEEIKTNVQHLADLQVELQNQRALEEISRNRGEIYASIIHDINGPLTVISGFIQILSQRIGDKSRLSGEDLEMLRDRLKRITRQVTNCIEISQRYLNLMRHGSDQASTLGLKEILEDLSELLSPHPSAAKHSVIIDSPSSEIRVKMNGTDLIQILLNLSINALQSSATPIEVRLTSRVRSEPLPSETDPLAKHDRWLHLENAARNGLAFLELTVADTGPGIPPENLSRIFDPYFTTKPPRRGTGLGLSIVSRLVREAKAVLHVNSIPGVGSRFTLFLPLVSAGSPSRSGAS
jgi:signal transduction histidine kinase